jgi:hypothetical protein
MVSTGHHRSIVSVAYSSAVSAHAKVAGVDFVDVMAPPGVVSFARSGAERTWLR